MEKRDGKLVRLSSKVIQALEALKHPGQSYDGVIQELLVKAGKK